MPPSQIETIDMARRGIHNEGARVLQLSGWKAKPRSTPTPRAAFSPWSACCISVADDATPHRPLPQSVLFCCDHNAVRSPMAEGMMKQLLRPDHAMSNPPVSKNDMEIDGFAVAVCAELGIELARHRSRSFDEMQEWGDDLDGFELIVALSPASQRRALDLTRYYHLDVEYWPILDPTGLGEAREDRLASYRQARDQIRERILARFGDPQEPVSN